MKREHKFRELFIFNGDKFVKLREITSLKYLRTLVTSIQQAEEVIAIMNELNNDVLTTAKSLSNDNTEKLKERKQCIDEVISNIKEIFKLAKEAPNFIETFKHLEIQLCNDARELEELYGGGIKAFREDNDKIFDTGKPINVNKIKHK